MQATDFDVMVIGAGIVGVSIAVHLQKRGRSVLLVDRRSPGQETSFGNAGFIQKEAVFPYAFPRQPREILRYALNRGNDVQYHADALRGLAPFLWRYWKNSSAKRHLAIARHYATLIEPSVAEHRYLAEQSGVSWLLRPGGFTRICRSSRDLDKHARITEAARREFGLKANTLGQAELRALEPDLDPTLAGGIHYTETETISDPGALVRGYFDYFLSLGGEFRHGDAASLEAHTDAWGVDWNLAPEIALDNASDVAADVASDVASNAGQANGHSTAKHAVLALGPWAEETLSRLGYRLLLGVKRGYHMHYRALEGKSLARPFLDAANGYVLSPMANGIRLTTGVELANKNAPKTPSQLARVEPIARATFPFGPRIEVEPWMGMRPCTPDMLPVIGAAPSHKGLWFAFGHGHQGMTMGPITGRLMADLITGDTPVVEPFPFRADRPQLQR
jgi:D-amino-acid dehydrogenase